MHGEIDDKKLIDKFRGCLLGLAIGDALGMPVETMTPEAIRAATGGQGVTGYLAPLQTKLEGTRNLPPGAVTDDTLLSFAVARSLIRCGHYDQIDQAREFVAEFDRSPLGWGWTTRKGAAEIKAWFRTGGQAGRHPSQPAAHPTKPGEGAGNGVAMKVAPLALFEGRRHGPLVAEYIFSFGQMTHGDIRASLAAVSVCDIVSDGLWNGTGCFGFTDQSLMDTLLSQARIDENWRSFLTAGREKYSDRLEMAFHSLSSGENLRETVGTGCYCLESVPYAIGVFLRHQDDFRAAVLEAVNAGGDTDSTASMVGAMVGANVGLAGIPADLASGCLVRDEALQLADALYAVATK